MAQTDFISTTQGGFSVLILLNKLHKIKKDDTRNAKTYCPSSLPEEHIVTVYSKVILDKLTECFKTITKISKNGKQLNAFLH